MLRAIHTVAWFVHGGAAVESPQVGSSGWILGNRVCHTLVVSHETEASRLRAELEVLRVAIKDKTPVSLVTRAAEAEDEYARLQREWDVFRETNERDVAAALRASDQERAQHGAAKLAYTERARSLKRKLQAATHPDKAPVEVRQWATRVFQHVFEPGF